MIFLICFSCTMQLATECNIMYCTPYVHYITHRMLLRLGQGQGEDQAKLSSLKGLGLLKPLLQTIFFLHKTWDQDSHLISTRSNLSRKISFYFSVYNLYKYTSSQKGLLLLFTIIHGYLSAFTHFKHVHRLLGTPGYTVCTAPMIKKIIFSMHDNTPHTHTNESLLLNQCTGLNQDLQAGGQNELLKYQERGKWTSWHCE